MFLTDFRTRKYTGGIISRVGIFLTVTPAASLRSANAPTIDKYHSVLSVIELFCSNRLDYLTFTYVHHSKILYDHKFDE